MAAKLLDVQTLGRQFVDRYELIGEIASGGMATVYLARLTGVGGFQRLFAIKRLHPHLAGEKEFVEMFLDEARLAAGIHHPHVVPILEVGASPGGYYLVMEYIEGETFARLLARAASQKSPIPASIVIRIGLDMLAGLHAAHELRDDTGALAGVVHRDVSPQNVLVGVDGVTRITDFGVARAASRLTATRVGQLKGKIAYMAPEQARGEESIDRRADVFAAGIVIWEGLAHRRLFKAENEAGTLARVIHEPIPHLLEAAPEIPREVADVVMRALSRDLTVRYATCAAFADALERAAMANQLLVTGRDMLDYLSRTIGPEMQEQREALRAWVARTEGDVSAPIHQLLTPSEGRPLPSLSGEVSLSQSLPRMPQRSRGWGWQVGSLIALALIGAGGFMAFRAFTQSKVANDQKILVSPPSVELDDKPAPSVEPTSPPPPEVDRRPEPTEAPEPEEPEVPVAPSTRAPKGATGSSKSTGSTKEPAPTTSSAPTEKPTPKKPPDPLDALNSNPYR